MKHARHKAGFSAVELLMVLALGAVVLGGVMVAYGTLVSNRAGVAESVSINLPVTLVNDFYGPGQGAARTVPLAPAYGSLALAEKLREEFHKDILGAAGVFCLYRRNSRITNPLRRNWFAYNPAVDGPLERPRDFYDFLVRLDPVAATVFEVPANPGTNNRTPDPHASVYVTSFSPDQTRLGIIALYEVDLLRFEQQAVKPWGFYATVRRYTHDPLNPTSQASVLSGGYEVFFPPSVPNPTLVSQFSTDGFSPVFVFFERAVRRSVIEDSVMGGDRFKVAAERPFYFFWWPDPAMPNLATLGNGTVRPQEARRAYNHMGGKTSFMFTVPMFPAL
jgi:hypothetical protein